NSMKVGGNAFFTGAVFEGPVDLGFSDFAVLDLSGAVYAEALYLQGMSYKKILAALDEHQSHEALLTANRLTAPMCMATWKRIFCVRVTAATRIELSSRGSGANETKIFKALVGSGVGCSIGSSLWLSAAFFFRLREWNRKSPAMRTAFTIASGIASACSFLSWISKLIECGSRSRIRLF